MTAGKDYMRASRPGAQPPSAQSRGVPYPPLELPIPEGAKVIPLPKPQDYPLPVIDFKELIEKRRTLRKISACGSMPSNLPCSLDGNSDL